MLKNLYIMKKQHQFRQPLRGRNKLKIGKEHGKLM
jgi:hypothetical protein